YDQYDNIKTDYTGTIQFRTSDPNTNGNVVLNGQAIPAGLQTDVGTQYTFTGTGLDDGTHDFNRTLFTLETKGNQTITIYDTVKTTIRQTSNPINVVAGGINTFTLIAPGTVTAGVPFTLTVSNAIDAVGNLADGIIAITFTDAGPHLAPDLTAPTLNNITVVNGSGSAIQTLVKEEGPVVNMLTGDDTVTPATATTGDITINSGPLNHFTFTTQPSANETVDTNINVVIEARDTYDNLVTSFDGAAGDATITDVTNTVEEAPVGSADTTIRFTNGEFNGNLVVRASHGADIITVRNLVGIQSGSSNTFQVVGNEVLVSLLQATEPRIAVEGNEIAMFDIRIENPDAGNAVTFNSINILIGSRNGGTENWTTVIAADVIDYVKVEDLTNGGIAGQDPPIAPDNFVDVNITNFPTQTIAVSSSIDLRVSVKIKSGFSGVSNIMIGFGGINGTRPPLGAVNPVNNLTDKLPVNDPNNYPTYFIKSGLTQIGPAGVAVEAFNYPNPFNPRTQSTNIVFFNPAGNSSVSIKIFTLTGRLVRTLSRSGLLQDQSQEVEWDGKNGKGQVVRNGVYVAVIQIGGSRAMIKIAVVK
ncbi:MAG: T9SS type A sorting domain-containing protein, partial [Spirochaetota bacterium]